ncbi:hypothetical protein PHLCEN_2v8100 [Hermanssonia centrifuga]|uniref:Uncharacterized protein n=1 Tax=Hermanssonia centrifuga TaxID=98765 RepID=A0A2R6NUT1_9APHY|nr:hypothetical protein PHLCEN_2v8100 [Hermanssonia centrifuga]
MPEDIEQEYNDGLGIDSDAVQSLMEFCRQMATRNFTRIPVWLAFFYLPTYYHHVWIMLDLYLVVFNGEGSCRLELCSSVLSTTPSQYLV